MQKTLILDVSESTYSFCLFCLLCVGGYQLEFLGIAELNM